MVIGCSLGIFIYLIIQIFRGDFLNWVVFSAAIIAVTITVIAYILAEKRILSKIWNQLDPSEKSETVSWKNGRVHYLKVTEDTNVSNEGYLGNTVLEIKYPCKTSDKQFIVFADRITMKVISLRQQ
ncbi:hypothetical protein LGQ02_10190 [Bacillus shivajii]|uniref:hypothetical protein n=1 Tax=Bacillus shivajii TaxID=1983719 RepID=UPI001CF99BCC|nr:hypothetical protein [Bacillus shivajii]UCZ55061.1 hypothetical protein LGQ02_10190 [Bacillus shivajii]